MSTTSYYGRFLLGLELKGPDSKRYGGLFPVNSWFVKSNGNENTKGTSAATYITNHNAQYGHHVNGAGTFNTFMSYENSNLQQHIFNHNVPRFEDYFYESGTTKYLNTYVRSGKITTGDSSTAPPLDGSSTIYLKVGTTYQFRQHPPYTWPNSGSGNGLLKFYTDSTKSTVYETGVTHIKQKRNQVLGGQIMVKYGHKLMLVVLHHLHYILTLLVIVVMAVLLI